MLDKEYKELDVTLGELRGVLFDAVSNILHTGPHNAMGWFRLGGILARLEDVSFERGRIYERDNNN